MGDHIWRALFAPAEHTEGVFQVFDETFSQKVSRVTA